MKNKHPLSWVRRIFCAALAFLWIAVCAAPPLQAADPDTVGQAEILAGGIVAFKAGGREIQEWIDTDLASGVGGAAEWYVLALSQSGRYDFSVYTAALERYLKEERIPSATTREKYALAMLAAGGGADYARSILPDAAGKQGVMSWIYGLHILNNGVEAPGITADDAVDALCRLECEGGGWTIMGDVADTDVTAMAVQALAPQAARRSDAQEAVERAVDLLSGRQREDGDCIGFGGVLNPESTAQVITALSALGIDCGTDERFLTNGKSLFDGLMKYRLPDGSFCHALGDGMNENATVQAFYTAVAYLRMNAGAGSLYVLTGPYEKTEPGAVPEEPEAADPAETGPVSPGPTAQEPEEPGAALPETEAAEPAAPETGAAPAAEEAAPETEAPPAQIPETKESFPAETEAPAVSGAEAPAESGGGAAAESARKAGAYKKWAYLGVAAAGVLACAVFFALGKRNPKNFAAIAVFVLAGAAFVRFTDFQSVETYYRAAEEKENAVGTVTLTIRCDTVAGQLESDLIPADGVILPLTEYAIEEGETAFDVLTEAAKEYGIQMESRGSGGMIYVSGICYLYEYDFGDLSGWMYRVNGETPGVGSDSYRLTDGDCVEWLYSCEIGNDLD